MGRKREKTVTAPGGSAKEKALRLLALRQRTVNELREKLLDKGYPAPEVDNTISNLTERGYLNDELFTRGFIQSRIVDRRWGRIKIAFELGKKGVARETIESILNEFEDSLEVRGAKEALEKWAKKNNLKHPLKKDTLQRAMRHLMGRGFPFAVIQSALKDPLKDTMENPANNLADNPADNLDCPGEEE